MKGRMKLITDEEIININYWFGMTRIWTFNGKGGFRPAREGTIPKYYYCKIRKILEREMKRIRETENEATTLISPDSLTTE